MKIKALSQETLSLFIDYCKKYGPEHDESFVTEEAIQDFKIDEENPSYLLVNESDEAIGAVSLILDNYMKRGKKGRFRILHALTPEKEAYKRMLDTILANHTEAIDKLFLFIPEEREAVREVLDSLGFKVERYSYFLERDDIDISTPVFPKGYALKTFRFDKDEEAWCHVRNTAFANLAGHQTPVTPEMIHEIQYQTTYIKGGLMALWHDESPIGVIRVDREMQDGNPMAIIGPLALLPEYHGKGLGRNMLRAGVLFGKENGMPVVGLCVNAENEKAAALYLSEGFEKKLAMICYNYDI